VSAKGLEYSEGAFRRGVSAAQSDRGRPAPYPRGRRHTSGDDYYRGTRLCAEGSGSSDSDCLRWIFGDVGNSDFDAVYSAWVQNLRGNRLEGGYSDRPGARGWRAAGNFPVGNYHF